MGSECYPSARGYGQSPLNQWACIPFAVRGTHLQIFAFFASPHKNTAVKNASCDPGSLNVYILRKYFRSLDELLLSQIEAGLIPAVTTLVATIEYGES